MKVTTSEITVALRERYCAPEFAFFQEVGDSGSSSSVYADGVAINMWASRGYAITGFEVKASRSDWLRELKQPEKAEPILTRCDYWYLVAPDEVFQIDEVPPSWGILSFKDGKLREKRKAPKLEPKPITRAFVAQMFRRAHVNETKDIQAQVDKALAADRASMRASIEREVESRTRHLKEDGDKWKAFMASLGQSKWTPSEDIIQAVKVVLACGALGSYHGVQSHVRNLRAAAEQAEKSLSIFKVSNEADAA